MMPAATPVLLHGFRVEADDGAVPDARHTITSLVRSWNVALSDEQVAEVELLSTEVITNAIHHTQAPCAVAVQWNGVRLRVEVTDTSRARLKPRSSSPDAEDGRGLLLVDALAADWGSVYDPAGKVVWFEVASSIRPARRKQPPPWSTPGSWAITTSDGAVTAGYLPAWAEDDPTETGVPTEELPQRLAQVNHRAFFEGPMMPLSAPDVWEGVEEDSVFEGSIDSNPYDPDPRLRVPLVNLQVSVGRWILGLDPDGLADIATKLRAHADLLDHKVRPTLIAAREDWAAHHKR